MGKASREAVHGIVLLDKPLGMSSNQAVQRVKHIYNARKAGHTGSLDPLATGLLPVCLGEATKASHWLLSADKAYIATLRLGQRTSTDDAEGEVVAEKPVPILDSAEVDAVLTRFTGDIMQTPPIYSALKRNGVPLYKHARRGTPITPEARAVHIRAIRLLSLSLPHLQLEVTCGAGTYIRALARDIGEALGCGAHLRALRRLWVTPFTEPHMLTLDTLRTSDRMQRQQALLPVDAAFKGWSRVVLNATDSQRIRQGQMVPMPQLPRGHHLACDAEERLLAVVERREDGGLYSVRGFNLG